MRWLSLSIVLLLVVVVLPPAQATMSPYPVIVGTSSFSQSAATTHAVTLPIFESDHALFLLCAVMGSNQAVTWPTNWYAITSGTTTRLGFVCGYSIKSNQTNPITVTLGGSETFRGIVYAIDNAQALEFAVPTTGNNANPAPPALIAATTDDRLWIVACFWSWDRAATVSAYPSGYILDQRTVVSDTGMAIAAKNQTIGAVTPSTFTLSGADYWGAETLTVRAAVAPPLAAIDYFPVWILLAIFLVLLVSGFKFPFIHVFAGIVGILLAIQLLNNGLSPVLSTVIAGFGVMLMITGAIRRS